MNFDANNIAGYLEVDAALKAWQQGDCVLHPSEFVYKHLSSLPVTSSPLASSGSESEILIAESPGLVLVSQTCDIQRNVNERPYVEMAALVRCPDSFSIEDVKKGLRPRYASSPAAAEQGLIADLDQIMTIEKPLLASWPRTRGCRNDPEIREFGRAIGRKFERFAFPDDFNRWVSKFIGAVKDKHGRKESEEGAAFRALREVRIMATPDWDSQTIELFFFFVREESQPNCKSRPWAHWVSQWCSYLKPAGRYKTVDAAALPLSKIRADEYVGSDRLDLDNLSWAANET